MGQKAVRANSKVTRVGRGDKGDEVVRERQLVEGLCARDPQAFERLVRVYGPEALAIASRLTGNQADGRDCVQEAFLSVFRSINDFAGRSALRTWIRRIVVNAALMKVRAGRARPEELVDPQSPAYDEFAFRDGPRRANSFTPEELLSREETRGIVQGALEALSEPYRIILVLRDFEGYSTGETAQLLSVSEGVVKTRLHRARNALKEKLQPLFEEDAF